ncbi:protein kinase [Gemmatimonadota bacterium]
MTDPLSRLSEALADRYKIEREIGRGGMAVVYLAQDLKHERQVAVKVLRPELAAAVGAERFQQEIKIAANLNHPHVLPLLDSGESDGFLYYVMPYVEGQSLRDKLAKEGELPIVEAVKILREVVDALAHAHDNNVVHRDMKPDNVLLSGRHALVTDFGVAKAVSEATGSNRITTEGVALGTPAYMAPEQAAADPHIDHRADIYAVGVIAYELLTGRTPFVGNTQQELLAAHVTQTPDPVTKYRESVPPALAELVMKCLEKKAADRWQTAEELLPPLEALATPSGGTTPVGTVPISAVKRSKTMAISASAIAVVLAVVVVVMLLPRGSSLNLNSNHVVVAVVRNATGDPSLDLFGERLGDWITQGLQQAAIPVTPWDMALQAWAYVDTEAEAGRVRDRVTALAEETGAGIVISGAVYATEGDGIEVRMNVTDAGRGRSLGTIEPLTGSRSNASEIITDVQQQVMGFLAINFDERFSSSANLLGAPPAFEAYQAFKLGMEQYFLRHWQDALPYFYQAFELDTTFVTALRYAILTHTLLNQWAQGDSLVGVFERFRSQLSDYSRHNLDYLNAYIGGDYPIALQAIRQAADLAPASKAVHSRAVVAWLSNRPQEAVDALLSLDPERGAMRGWRGYFQLLEWAYLTLGEHDKALETAQRYRETFGVDSLTLGFEGFALVALGRADEVNVVLDNLSTLPEQSINQGSWMVNVAAFQRVHSPLNADHTAIDRALRWYEARTPEEKSNALWRWDYAWAFYVANRCDDAYGVAKPLSEEFPEDVDYRGFVGVLAACRGDQEVALEISQWLESLDRPYLRGNHTAWRSWIAGALGDSESAVVLWRQAAAQGKTYYGRWFSRNWIAFEPIRYDPGFQELMRPKG